MKNVEFTAMIDSTEYDVKRPLTRKYTNESGFPVIHLWNADGTKQITIEVCEDDQGHFVVGESRDGIPSVGSVWPLLFKIRW